MPVACGSIDVHGWTDCRLMVNQWAAVQAFQKGLRTSFSYSLASIQINAARPKNTVGKATRCEPSGPRFKCPCTRFVTATVTIFCVWPAGRIWLASMAWSVFELIAISSAQCCLIESEHIRQLQRSPGGPVLTSALLPSCPLHARLAVPFSRKFHYNHVRWPSSKVEMTTQISLLLNSKDRWHMSNSNMGRQICSWPQTTRRSVHAA